MILVCKNSGKIKYGNGSSYRFTKGDSYRIEAMDTISSFFCIKTGYEYVWIHKQDFKIVDKCFGKGTVDIIKEVK